MEVVVAENGVKALQKTYGKDVPKVEAITASVLNHLREAYKAQGFVGVIDKRVRQEVIYRYLATELGVSFEFIDEAPAADETWQGASLASELLHSLLSAASNQEIIRLCSLIVEMENLGQRERALAAHLSELCSKYDLEGVRSILEQIGGSIQPG